MCNCCHIKFYFMNICTFVLAWMLCEVFFWLRLNSWSLLPTLPTTESTSKTMTHTPVKNICSVTKQCPRILFASHADVKVLKVDNFKNKMMLHWATETERGQMLEQRIPSPTNQQERTMCLPGLDGHQTVRATFIQLSRCPHRLPLPRCWSGSTAAQRRPLWWPPPWASPGGCSSWGTSW